jgi:hypothetical protein
MQMRRREGADDVPSPAPAAASSAETESNEMFGTRATIDASPESVRNLHAAMYRRLRRHMELHRSILTDDAWKLLTRVAFSLYVDSRETRETLPIASVMPPAPVVAGRRR